MLGEALRFPIAGDEGVKSVIIGGVMLFVSFLIIPILFVQGYLVRVLRTAVEDGDEAPTFDDWGEMLVDGVKLLVINVVYALVPLALFFFTLFGFIGIAAIGAGSGGEPSPGALAGLGLVGLLLLLLSVLLLLLVAYVVPAAAANFARHDDLGAAFDFGTVFDAAFSADYFVAGVLAIVIGLVVGIVSLLLGVLTFGLFFLVLVFVQFYVQVSIYYLFGRGFAKALDVDGNDGSPAPDTAVAE